MSFVQQQYSVSKLGQYLMFYNNVKQICYFCYIICHKTQGCFQELMVLSKISRPEDMQDKNWAYKHFPE